MNTHKHFPQAEAFTVGEKRFLRNTGAPPVGPGAAGPERAKPIPEGHEIQVKTEERIKVLEAAMNSFVPAIQGEYRARLAQIQHDHLDNAAQERLMIAFNEELLHRAMTQPGYPVCRIDTDNYHRHLLVIAGPLKTGERINYSAALRGSPNSPQHAAARSIQKWFDHAKVHYESIIFAEPRLSPETEEQRSAEIIAGENRKLDQMTSRNPSVYPKLRVVEVRDAKSGTLALPVLEEFNAITNTWEPAAVSPHVLPQEIHLTPEEEKMRTGDMDVPLAVPTTEAKLPPVDPKLPEPLMKKLGEDTGKAFVQSLDRSADEQADLPSEQQSSSLAARLLEMLQKFGEKFLGLSFKVDKREYTIAVNKSTGTPVLVSKSPEGKKTLDMQDQIRTVNAYLTLEAKKFDEDFARARIGTWNPETAPAFRAKMLAIANAENKRWEELKIQCHDVFASQENPHLAVRIQFNKRYGQMREKFAELKATPASVDSEKLETKLDEATRKADKLEEATKNAEEKEAEAGKLQQRLATVIGSLQTMKADRAAGKSIDEAALSRLAEEMKNLNEQIQKLKTPGKTDASKPTTDPPAKSEEPGDRARSKRADGTSDTEKPSRVETAEKELSDPFYQRIYRELAGMLRGLESSVDWRVTVDQKNNYVQVQMGEGGRWLQVQMKESAGAKNVLRVIGSSPKGLTTIPGYDGRAISASVDIARIVQSEFLAKGADPATLPEKERTAMDRLKGMLAEASAGPRAFIQAELESAGLGFAIRLSSVSGKEAQFNDWVTQKLTRFAIDFKMQPIEFGQPIYSFGDRKATTLRGYANVQDFIQAIAKLNGKSV